MAGGKPPLGSDSEDEDDVSWATPRKQRATHATTPIPVNDGTPNGVVEAEAATEPEPHAVARDMFENWPGLDVQAGEAENLSPIEKPIQQPALGDADGGTDNAENLSPIEKPIQQPAVGDADGGTDNAEGGGAKDDGTDMMEVEEVGIGVEEDKKGKAAADLQ